MTLFTRIVLRAKASVQKVHAAVRRFVNHRDILKRVILGSIAFSIVLLTLVPLVFLLWTSLWSGFPGQFGATFTLENFVAVYREGAYDVVGLFASSLFIAIGMTAVAVSFGLLFAWLFTRTNLPTKGIMELVILSPYAVPVYIYAIMYIATYGPTHGVVSTYIIALLGVETAPYNIFSPWGIAFVVGIKAMTTVYLLTAPALQNMDPSLEEAGRVHGANIYTTIRSISFPLILPAILSALLVTFLRGLGEFSVVAILGAREGFDVYATAIWESVRLRAPPRYGEAAALAFSLLLVCVVLVWYYRKVTSRKEDFMTVTGQGYQAKTWDLGVWRWPIAVGLWTLLVIVWILPVLVMVLVSLHSVWTGQPDLSTLTVTHYWDALTVGRLRNAFTNSIIVSVVGASIGTVLVVGMAYYTERTEYRGRGIVDFLSLTPMAIPGIILGGSVLFTFLWAGNVIPWLNLYGTLWIIIIGSVIVFIPIASRIAVGNIVQVHSDLEESARVTGASWIQQMREVFLPLFKDTTAVIWFYFMIQIFHLLTIPIMTYQTGTEVIAVEVFVLYTREANIELVSAISTIFIGLTLLVLLVFRAAGITFYDLGRR